MAMGEIASSMPTAGALYYWSSQLGSPAWGWFTGWFNLVGQIAVTAAIDYGAAIFTTALLNLWFPNVVGTDTSTIFVVYTVIMALHIALNLLNINLLAMLNTISAWWHMAGVAVDRGGARGRPAAPVGRVRVHPDHRQLRLLRSRVRLRLRPRPDHVAYTITGYDASAHMSEETRQASRSAAIGMVMSVVVSVFFGFILLVAITFAVPDVQGTLDAVANAVVYIWTTSLGNAWAEFLLLIAVVAQFFCGTASVTSASRMMFAFSRDRAVPGSKVWRKVARNRVPVNAVLAIAVLSWVIMLPTLFSVVATWWRPRSRSSASTSPSPCRSSCASAPAARFEAGAWSLGRHYRWISPLAVAWIAFICVVGILLPSPPTGVPGADEFDWKVVNYSPITVVAAVLLFGGWYLLSARNWFVGPIPDARLDDGLRWSITSEDITSQAEQRRPARRHRRRPPRSPTCSARTDRPCRGPIRRTRVRVRPVASHDPASDPGRIVLLRHGETEWSAQRPAHQPHRHPAHRPRPRAGPGERRAGQETAARAGPRARPDQPPRARPHHGRARRAAPRTAWTTGSSNGTTASTRASDHRPRSAPSSAGWSIWITARPAARRPSR